MTTRQFKTVRLSVLALAGLLATGCDFFSEKALDVRIGLNAWPGYEFLTLAKAKGFFEKRKLNVKIIEFNSLSDSRQSFEQENLDVLGTTVVEALMASHNSSVLPKIFYAVDYSSGGDMIYAQSNIKNMAQLKGKKIGLELGSLQVFELFRALDLANMKLSEVTIISIDPSNIEAKFLAKEVDAVVTYPPFSIKLRAKSPKLNEVFNSQQIPGELVDVLIANNSFAQQHPEAIDAIVAAFSEAYEYALKNPDGIELMAKREGISPQEFKATLAEDIRMYKLAQQPDFLKPDGPIEKLVRLVEKTLIDLGQIKGPPSSTSLVWRKK